MPPLVLHLNHFKELLENVQRRATKLVPGLANLSYPDRLRQLNMPTLAYRRLRGDMIQTYKLLNGGYDGSLPNILQTSTTGLRGNKKKLYMKGPNKDIGLFSFTTRVCRLWNSLPDEIVTAENVKSFEIALDRHWANQDLMYNDFKADISI